MSKRKNEEEIVGEPIVVEFVDSEDTETIEVVEEANQNGRKKKKSFRVKVAVVRGVVYAIPSALARGVAAAGRGNLILVVDEFKDEDNLLWYNVETHRRGEKVSGWIQASKVVRV